MKHPLGWPQFRLRSVLALVVLLGMFLGVGMGLDWLRGWIPGERVFVLLLAIVAYGFVGFAVCSLLATSDSIGRRRKRGPDPFGPTDEAPKPGEHNEAVDKRKAPGRIRFQSHHRSMWPFRW